MSSSPDTNPARSPIVGAQSFPCKQCGARLEYAPGTSVLVCPYCDCRNEIAAPTGQVEEIDYLATLKDLSEHAEKFERMTVKCGACAAEIEAPENTTSFSCPFCGSNIVATAHSSTAIKPNAVLPFMMTREQAIGMFRKWLGTLWFAPTLLKSNGFIDASFTGLYVPAWTYDALTRTRYTGERGDAYYETESVTVNGRRETRQVRKIRWWPVSGEVQTDFDDVLVMATRSLRAEHLESLDPWNLPELVPYSDDYLAGFKAECYTVGLEEGFEGEGGAKTRMRLRILSDIEHDIGGDEQRISSTNTRYYNVTFKHILLPVWLSAYRYNNKVFRFMVNARTGEVVGERPYSPIKIALFTIMCVILLVIAVVIFANVQR